MAEEPVPAEPRSPGSKKIRPDAPAHSAVDSQPSESRFLPIVTQRSDATLYMRSAVTTQDAGRPPAWMPHPRYTRLTRQRSRLSDADIRAKLS